MNQDHYQTVVKEFTAQSTIWSGPIPSGLTEMVATLNFKPTDHVIDVAAGSCRVSRAVAPFVNKVTAVEITGAMLEEGREMAAKEGLSNLAFHLGPAESLPYGPAEFDVAITRYSFHHFVDAQAVLREIVRVTKPQGRVIVIDILSPEDDRLAQVYNRHQQIRDPSHTKSPQLEKLREWYGVEGLAITDCYISDEASELEAWLGLPNLSDETKAEIRANVQAELNGGQPTGLQPFIDKNTLKFREQVVTIIGEKNV